MANLVFALEGLQPVARGDEGKLLPKWQVTAQSGPQGMNLADFLEREKDDTARLCSAAKNSQS